MRLITLSADREANEKPSSDKTLDSRRKKLAAARFGAMQVLVCQTQNATDDADGLAPEEFMKALSDLRQAQDSLHDIGGRHLRRHELSLPDALGKPANRLKPDLAGWTRSLQRRGHSPDGDIRGLRAVVGLCDL